MYISKIKRRNRDEDIFIFNFITIEEYSNFLENFKDHITICTELDIKDFSLNTDDMKKLYQKIKERCKNKNFDDGFICSFYLFFDEYADMTLMIMKMMVAADCYYGQRETKALKKYTELYKKYTDVLNKFNYTMSLLGTTIENLKI